MDSSKVHVPVPLPPGLHSVQAGAIAATHPATSVPSGSAFPAVAAGPSNSAALQAAREAAALRESYLKNEKKQKCATCGNTARARCPYRSCRTCCMKNNKMCYIHVQPGKTEMATNGSTMMGTAYEQYQAAADMAKVNMPPQFRQPAPPTYVQSGGAGAGRYQSPAPGMGYGPQYYRPPFPGTHAPPHWSKTTPSAPQAAASHTREQLEYMRLKSYRAAAQAMQKEANALSAWRMRKWKEFDEVETALEDEAFDRYASTMAWLEEVFSVDAPTLEGVSEDGNLIAEDVQVDEGTQSEIPAAELSMLSDGLRMRSASNPRKKELSRQKFKRGIERNLQKLKTKEENVEISIEDDDYNLPVLPLGRHAKRLKSTCKEGRDSIKRMDAFDYVLQKVNDIKSRDDIWKCVNLYKDSFGPAIGCILPHLTRSEDDFLGFAVAKRIKLYSANDPDWMDIDDHAVPITTLQPEEAVQADRMEGVPNDGLVHRGAGQGHMKVAAADVFESQVAHEVIKGQQGQGVKVVPGVDLEMQGAVLGQEGDDVPEVVAADILEDERALKGQPGGEMVQIGGANGLEDQGPEEPLGGQGTGVKVLAPDVVDDQGADGPVLHQEGERVGAVATVVVEDQGADGAAMFHQGEEAVHVIEADVFDGQEAVLDQLGEDGAAVAPDVLVDEGAVMGEQGKGVETMASDVLQDQGPDGAVRGQQGEGVLGIAADGAVTAHQGDEEVRIVPADILVQGEQGESCVAAVATMVSGHGEADQGVVEVMTEGVATRVEHHVAHDDAHVNQGRVEGGASPLGSRIWADGEDMDQVVLEDLKLVSDDVISCPVDQQGGDIITVEEIIAACELSGEMEASGNDIEAMDVGTPADTAIEGTAVSLEAITEDLDTVPEANATEPTIPEQTPTEIRKPPPGVEVPRPRPSANEDIVQPQNDFPAICVCAWRRVDMSIQTADEVLQALVTVEGLEQL